MTNNKATYKNQSKMKNKFSAETFVKVLIFSCIFISFYPVVGSAQSGLKQTEQKNTNKQNIDNNIAADKLPTGSLYPELDLYLNSREYNSLPDDSVYVPYMTLLSLHDERIQHLLDEYGHPINPIKQPNLKIRSKDDNSERNKNSLFLKIYLH